MSKIANTTVVTAKPATVGQWARELAAAQSGTSSKAAQRFVSVASYMGDVAANLQPGETKFVTFGQLNEKTGLQRGRTGDMVASWRLALQRTGQLLNGRENLPCQYAIGETGVTFSRAK